MGTHFTWSVESHMLGEEICPYCGRIPILVIAQQLWDVSVGDLKEDDEDVVLVNEEVTGHYCPDCRKLVSLSFNG